MGTASTLGTSSTMVLPVGGAHIFFRSLMESAAGLQKCALEGHGATRSSVACARWPSCDSIHPLDSGGLATGSRCSVQAHVATVRGLG
jgi:hypothetical protein